MILCAMLLIFMSLMTTKIQQEVKANYPKMWGEESVTFMYFDSLEPLNQACISLSGMSKKKKMNIMQTFLL